MYAMSRVNEDNFRSLANALSRSFSSNNPTKGVVPRIEKKEPSLRKTNIEDQRQYIRQLLESIERQRQEAINEEKIYSGKSQKSAPNYKSFSELESQLKQSLKANGIEDAVVIHLEERGLVVGMMTDKLLFPIGEATLTSNCKKILNTIAPVLNDCENSIRIEGNTCNLPIYTVRFQSNWELSTMRATNVAKYLITVNKITPERVSIIGYGEYKPKFPNITEANRAKNRRVDIVILNGAEFCTKNAQR